MTELPKGWAKGPFSEFIQPRGEKASPSDHPDLKFIGMDHVEAHTMRIIGAVPASEMKSSAARFYKHDVLYGRLRPYLNKVAQPTFDGLASAEFIVFGGNELVDASFLRYRLNSRDFVNFANHLNEGDRPRVSFDQFGNYELLIPPLNEQRRIVEKIEAMFERIDKGVENLRGAKATLALYRQSLLKSAFEGKLTADWRAQNAGLLETPKTLLARIQKERETRYKSALDDWQTALAEWRAGRELGRKPSKPRRDPEQEAPMSEQREKMHELPAEWQWLQIGVFAFVTKLAGFEYTDYVKYSDDGDLPVIKAENAGKAGFKVTDYSKVRFEDVAMLTRSHLKGGELLMVFVGAGTGNVATVPADRSYFLGPNIGMIRVETPDVISSYIEHFLRSPVGNLMKLASVKAVAQPSISMGTIRQIPIAIPSPAEQAEITRILDIRLTAADRMEAEIDAALSRADALRQSILKRAFAGNLVPQDPTDEPAPTLLARIKAERAKAGQNKQRRTAHA